MIAILIVRLIFFIVVVKQATYLSRYMHISSIHILSISLCVAATVYHNLRYIVILQGHLFIPNELPCILIATVVYLPTISWATFRLEYLLDSLLSNKCMLTVHVGNKSEAE